MSGKSFILYFAVIIFALKGIAWADAAYGFESAGKQYNIAPELLKAISKIESNHRADAVHLNTNKSVDVCHMQINSSTWRKELGFRWDYLGHPEYCTMVGAWILRGCIERYGYNWDAVACYHTGYSLADAPSEKKRLNGIAYIQRVKQALQN